MQGISIAAGAGYESKGNSKIEKGVLRAGSNSKGAWAEVGRVYADLQRQQPTATLNATALSGGKLQPGVYRIKGNVHLQKSLELLGSKSPNGVFVFQVEGDMQVDPAVNIELRQGAKAKNVFWQVAGLVTVGSQSSFKGTVVAANNITAGKNASFEGKLLSTNGKITLSNARVTDHGNECFSDLEVKQVVSEGPYRVGLLVTYTITLKNLGPDDENNVVVHFEMPSGIQYLSSTTSQGSSFNQFEGWRIAKFPKGSEATMVVQARIMRTEFSTTVATVTGDCADPNIKSNTSELSICATPSKPGEISGLTSLCVNTPGNVYRIEPMSGARKYNWTLPEGWAITSGLETNSITVTTGSAEANGTITVRAVNACGDGPETVLAVSTVSFPPPTPSAISGPQEICLAPDGIVYSINTVASAVSYSWELPSGWSIVKGQGTTFITVNAGSSGGKVKVTAENGCGKSASSEIQVTVSPAAPLKPNAISGPGQVCANSDGNTYEVPAVPNATSYTWTIPAGWSIVAGQGTNRITVRSGSSAGDVTVTAQNICGTSAVTSLPVTIASAAPVVGAISGETALCLSTAEHAYSVEEVENATTYTWSVPADWRILSGQGTRRINVKVGSSGEVRLVASNACGNGSAVPLKVAVGAGPPATPGTISGMIAPCKDQENLVYSVSAGADVATYTWTVPQGWTIISGQGTQSITVKAGSSAGNISVIGANGCGNSPERTLSVAPALAAPVVPASINGEAVPCVNGQQTYSVPNAVEGLTYTWTVPSGWIIVSGQGTGTLTVNAGANLGQVTVTASNSCGRSASTTMEVTPTTGAPALTASIQGEVAVCGNTNELTYSISSTNAASSFQWEVPTGWTIISGQGTREIKVKAGTSNGTIQVSARNGCGQSTTRSLAVAISSVLPATPGQITGPPNVCANMGEVTYSIAAVTDATSYIWSVPATWTIVRGQGTTSLVVRVGTMAEQVQVTATNACGTSAASRLNIDMSQAAPAPVGPITGEKAFCASSTTRTYTVAQNEEAKTFTWSVPAGWTIESGQGTRSIRVVPGSVGGYLKVVASNYCGSTSDSTNITISQPLATDPITINGTKASCLTTAPATYSVTAVSGATQYSWTVPAGWEILSGQNTPSIQVKAGAGSGNVSVAVSNTCGSSVSGSMAVSVSSTEPFSLGAIAGQSATCATTRVTYQVAADANVNTYTWTVPAGWTLESGQGTNSITVVPGNAGGTVSVTGENGCGVVSSPSTLQVQVQRELPLKPSPIQATALELTPCAGQNGLVFRIDPVNGATSYEWSFPADWKIESGQGTTSITLTAGSLPGQVSVVAKNGCGQSESQVVAVTPTTGAPVINGDIEGSAMVCANENGVTYRINASGASQYLWTVPSGWNLVSGQNTNTITVIPTTTGGAIKVEVQNGCGVKAEKSLAVTPSTAGTLNPGVINGPASFCASPEQVVYTVTQVDGAVAYEWTVPTGWSIISGQGTTSITAIGQAGAGQVSVKAVNGCGSSAAATLAVTVAPGLGTALEIKDESTVCVGNQFSVPAITGVSYKWSIVSDLPGWSITSGQGSNKVTLQGPADAPMSSARVVVEANNGTCSVTLAGMDVTPRHLASQLHIPNVFSPNHDGKNDLWVVRNLLEFPENELVIMNRWGSEVYRMKKYRNNWNGSDLAEGTYYYVLRVRLCEGQEVTHKGYVTIMR
ncbi:hypothetical protein DC20_09520 [Rufibacter tibetensis]|uniref:Uncharacterized protein n=1 Tax=Rufibacter tibetensis TaxID=512763 RepID=A0A0P0CV29_9BACT|nr:hypothetical protein DC20_09520 [Rufibacter tibetensis]